VNRRTTLLGLLLASVAVALTACQASPGAAAFVGDDRVTAEQLQSDLDSALATPKLKEGVTQQYGADLSTFRRQLLNDRVRHELVDAAVRRTGVTVSDDEVLKLIESQGGFDRARDAGHWSHNLAVRHFKDLLLTAELGYAQQHVHRPTEAELRAAYDQQAPTQTQVRLGLIQVPDRGTLNQVIAQLRADPSQFAAVAAKYPGSAPEPASYTPANIPASIRTQLLAAKPDDILPFVGTDQTGAGQYLAVKVFGVRRPTFEDLRLQLSLPSLSEAFDAGQAYLATLAKQVGVRVNPRYGTWNSSTAQIDQAPNPLVTLQPTPTPTPSGGAAAGS
jgi:SurA-like N-terminal domain